MLHAKIDPDSNITIKEDDVKSIVDWFEQHNQVFYTMGTAYLKNQHQMDELFYRAILKVYKDLPRFKNETTFEAWVTSIFIQICRELSSDKGLQVLESHEQRPELFKVLDSLKEQEKEAIVLTYIKGISLEETAKILKVSEDEVKESLFSGIQSLRKGLEYRGKFNGCKEYQRIYIDYLERTLDRPKKIDFEVHIYHCKNCQDDLATFQEVMLTLISLTEKLENFHVPTGFMEKVKERIEVEEQQRRQKNEKIKKRGLVFAGVFALLMGIGFFTGVFSSLYYTWTEEDKELRALLQQDLGERLNLEAESDSVKITIKSAIADDFQTLVFYEIEDTKEDNQYMMNYGDGVSVENEREILDGRSYPRYYPPDLETELNNEEKNIYHGRISLPPIRKDSGTIKLNITNVLKLEREPSDENRYSPYGNPEFATGEWNFEIPVTKQPTKEYALGGETEVEGIAVRFEKLTIGPTATTLQYSIKNEPEKRVGNLIFSNLQVNNKKVKADMYGSSFVYTQQDMNWEVFQVHFDPLFAEKPKEVSVQFESAHMTFEDDKSIVLDASQEYPQTFEYAGSTISIDKVELGPPAEVVISNHEVEGRAYENFHFDIAGEDQNIPNSMEMESEGMLVDRYGKVYDINKGPIKFEEIEQPRYFTTVHRMRLHSNTGEEDVIPRKLNIYGYNTTIYLDDVVKIKVD